MDLSLLLLSDVSGFQIKNPIGHDFFTHQDQLCLNWAPNLTEVSNRQTNWAPNFTTCSKFAKEIRDPSSSKSSCKLIKEKPTIQRKNLLTFWLGSFGLSFEVISACPRAPDPLYPASLRVGWMARVAQSTHVQFTRFPRSESSCDPGLCDMHWLEPSAIDAMVFSLKQADHLSLSLHTFHC